jgi:hypothetical protein
MAVWIGLGWPALVLWSVLYDTEQLYRIEIWVVLSILVSCWFSEVVSAMGLDDLKCRHGREVFEVTRREASGWFRNET